MGYWKDNLHRRSLQANLCRFFILIILCGYSFTEIRYRILKRRIAWLIGRWVHASDDMKPSQLVWQILTGLLSGQAGNTDTVVQLSVIVALKQCVDVGAVFLMIDSTSDQNQKRAFSLISMYFSPFWNSACKVC
jgi:hypothetical protein